MAALAAAVPDAGGVHFVNNGAAALALVTCALVTGREAVVARGQLVEIGDGFRIPELLESMGARLREVGTINRVRLSDYADAIDEQTAFVLKVHPSNFVVSGFTSSVGVEELASLPAVVVADIGSGLLTPQPRRHPFAPALRVDKLTLAALEATLTGPVPPVAAALACSPAHLVARAEHIASVLAPVVPATAVASEAAVGGGGAPEVSLLSAAVALPVDLAGPLRLDAALPIVGRVERGRLLLDLMAVAPADDALIAEVVRRAADRSSSES